MSKASGGKKQVRVQAARLLRKLEEARAAKQRAERKVGKLQVRLERAEVVLLKRAHRVDALEVRGQPQGASSGSSESNEGIPSAQVPDRQAGTAGVLSPVDVHPASVQDGIAAAGTVQNHLSGQEEPHQ